MASTESSTTHLRKNKPDPSASITNDLPKHLILHSSIHKIQRRNIFFVVSAPKFLIHASSVEVSVLHKTQHLRLARGVATLPRLTKCRLLSLEVHLRQSLKFFRNVHGIISSEIEDFWFRVFALAERCQIISGGTWFLYFIDFGDERSTTSAAAPQQLMSLTGITLV